MIYTTRHTVENEEGVIIKRDDSTIISDKGKISMPSTIEIECSSRDRIKKVKQQLSNFLAALGIDPKTVITKKTKEELAVELIKQAELDERP